VCVAAATSFRYGATRGMGAELGARAPGWLARPGSHAKGDDMWSSNLAMCVVLVTNLALAACATSTDPSSYRLANSGTHWDVVGDDAVFEDLQPLYPEFFEVILDPSRSDLPDVRPVRDDLERLPVTRRNFDALNAVAIAYFETNYRAEEGRGDGLSYMSLSQRAAKLVAIPWRAYGETESSDLRNAILDFLEDAGTGGKLHTEATAPRLARVVASLERKESDPARAQRIRSIAAELEALMPTAHE
jgi:hypothetical protein